MPMQISLLFLILAILALVGILVLLVLRKKPLRVYKPKAQYLLSIGEKKFYDALLAVIDSTRYIIFAKVRIADIIECSAPLGLDSWQSENQRVYYRQEGGTKWHNDGNLQRSSKCMLSLTW